ncbi:MAG: hypothetical protein JNM80_04170 [Phycisphaerae bacterium]|nr:hypothetical protein [Phycisphaerae bacterium]
MSARLAPSSATKRPEQPLGRMALLALAGAAAALTTIADSKAVERTTTRGPFTLVVRTDRDEMTVADRLRVAAWISVPPGARAEIADTGPKFGGFTVVSREPLPPEPVEGGGVRTGVALVLEPFLAGEYEVPAIVAACVEAGGARTDLASDPLAIPVRSIADEGEAEPAPARGVVEPAADAGARWWWVVGAGCVAAAVAGGAAVRRRKPRRTDGGVRAALAALEARRGASGPMTAEDADAIVRALRAAVASRGEPRAGQLDAEGLAACAARSLTHAEAETLRGVLARCDAARFGGEGEGDARADIDAAIWACRALVSAGEGGRA